MIEDIGFNPNYIKDNGEIVKVEEPISKRKRIKNKNNNGRQKRNVGRLDK